MKRNWCFAILFLIAAAGVGPRWVPAQTPPAAAEDLKSPNADTRALAARELRRIGDPAAVPALAAVINDPSVKVRREVVLTLSSLRVPGSLDPLIAAATKDPANKIRISAIQGLVGYYTGQSPSAGFVGFWQRAWRKAKSRFVEENVRVDPGVAVDPKVIAALVAAMNDPRALDASRTAADALGILVAKAAVPDLVRTAHSSDPDLAVEALNSLAKIRDRSAGPQLIDLLDSSNKEIKKQAAVTTGILRAQASLPKLQAMYENNPDKAVREKALEGLAYLGSPTSVPVFTKALWSSEKNLRVLGAEGLARARQASTLADLEKAAQAEKDAEAKLAIEFALTAQGKMDYFSALVDELGAMLHGDSAQTFLTELAQDPSFLPRLYPYLNSQNSAVRRRLCTVLMFAGDASSLPHLERLTRDPDADVATEAVRALRAVRQRSS